MFQRRAQQPRFRGITGGQQRSGIAALSKTDGKAVVAERLQEGGQLLRNQTRNLVDLFKRRMVAAAAHATFPSRRSVTSRVIRARSSRVLSRHIMVSKTASGTSCRSRTS